MNKAIGILLMLLTISCLSPTIQTDPKPLSCKGATLVLNTAGVNLVAWERANRYHKYTIENGRIYVTLSSIAPGYLSAWLYENNPIVMFDLSQRGILCHHVIAHIDRFDLEKENVVLTYKQIKDSLRLSGDPLTDSFRKYVEIAYDDPKSFEINASTSFKPANYYYSMAFFAAVGRVNEINGSSDETKFTFYRAKYQDEPVIVIEVNGKYKNYYDFAQYPPLQ